MGGPKDERRACVDDARAVAEERARAVRPARAHAPELALRRGRRDVDERDGARELGRVRLAPRELAVRHAECGGGLEAHGDEIVVDRALGEEVVGD